MTMMMMMMMPVMTTREVSGSDRSRDNQVQGHKHNKHNKHNMCTPDSYHDDAITMMMMMMTMMMILYDDPVMTITIHSRYDDMI